MQGGVSRPCLAGGKPYGEIQIGSVLPKAIFACLWSVPSEKTVQDMVFTMACIDWLFRTPQRHESGQKSASKCRGVHACCCRHVYLSRREGLNHVPGTLEYVLLDLISDFCSAITSYDTCCPFGCQK